jgi:hypothetical protein
MNGLRTSLLGPFLFCTVLPRRYCLFKNALLDRGYGKPTQPISQTLAKVDPSSISDEELAAIAMNGASVNATQAH